MYRLFTIYIALALTSSPLLAVTITFDAASDLSNNFQINGTNGNLTFQASGGVTSGAVDTGSTSSSDPAVLKTTSFALSAGTMLNTSVYWFYDSALRDPFNSRENIALGFSSATSAVSVESGVRLFTVANSTNIAVNLFTPGNVASAGQVTLTTGHWYKTVLTLNDVGGQFNQFDLSTTTDDYGTDGMSTPVSIPKLTFSRSFGSATLASTPQLLGAFSASGQSGTDRLDNYFVVPEPSSVLLVALGFVALSTFRKRKLKLASV